jgi:cytochrome c oxidase subunit 2
VTGAFPREEQTMGENALTRWTAGLAVLATTALWSMGAAAAELIGQPHPWEMTMQTPASTIAEQIYNFHDFLLVVTGAICLLVLVLMGIAVVRFNEKANPVPSRISHNSTIEVLWTVIPVLVLVIIAIPSFRLLRQQEIIPPSDLTIKITGNQWYWGVEYPEKATGFKFDALLLEDKDRLAAIDSGKVKPEEAPHLLAVDNEIVVPVNKVVRLQITAADVIHSFSVPSLGFRKDAVPGRLNETWFKADREGVFFGQCSRLCGKNHAFMPIAIRAVSDAKYAAWVAQAKQKFAAISGSTRIATNAAAQ